MTENSSDRKKQEEAAGLIAATEDLRKVQELRRLLGDPRVRVEVPVSGGSAEKPDLPIAKRYKVG